MQLAREWDRKLASEGLAPLETRTELARMIETVGTHHLDEAATAVGLWQDWARGVLRAHAFTTERHRKAWGFYALGWTYSEIALACGIDRRGVTQTIADVEADAPAPPCPNPWRKSGRESQRQRGIDQVAAQADPRVTARLLQLAVSAADPETLARLVATDATLNSMTGGAGMAEAVKRAVGEVRYSRIRLKRTETFRSPRSGKDLDVLLPAEFGGELVGRPHAGGIDLQAKVTTVQGKGGEPDTVAAKVFTLPWWKIDHAERVTEE